MSRLKFAVAVFAVAATLSGCGGNMSGKPSSTASVEQPAIGKPGTAIPGETKPQSSARVALLLPLSGFGETARRALAVIEIEKYRSVVIDAAPRQDTAPARISSAAQVP